MSDKLLQRIELISNPATKLELMLKKGLVREAEELVWSLLEKDGNIFFYQSDRDSIPSHALCVPEKIEAVDSANTLPNIYIVWHMDPVFEIAWTRSRTLAEVVLHFAGMCALFGWDNDKSAEFARRILAKVFAEDRKIFDRFWWMTDASVAVCRNLFSSSDELVRRVELTTLRLHLNHGRLFELRSRHLPVPMTESSNDGTDELDPIVDRFIELGWDMDQVKAEFLAMIKRVLHNCRPQFMIALAGAKCFTFADRGEQGELGQFLREHHRPLMWRELVTSQGGSFWVRMYLKLLTCGLSGNKAEDKIFYRSEFVRLLSEGYLARVWQLLVLLGQHVLFYATEDDAAGKARTYLGEMIPDAFTLAYFNGRYGVASALVQEFGAKACCTGNEKEDLRLKRHDQIAEVMSIALDLEQRVQFEDNLVYYHAAK